MWYQIYFLCYSTHVIWKTCRLSFKASETPNSCRLSYMRKATVAMTPQVWYAWWNSSSAGYFTAASMMIHQPVKNCKNNIPRLCKYVKSSIQIYICLYCLEEINGNTRTPAAIEAIVFLRSPQSTLHSQSPHRIPSRNPDMTLEKSKRRSKSGFELREQAAQFKLSEKYK